MRKMTWPDRPVGLGAFAVAAVLASCVATMSAQDPQDAAVRLSELRFQGLQRYEHADVVRLSGLVVGQPVRPTQLTEVAQQLTDTGLFTAMRYRYTTDEAGLTAEFAVAEAAWTVPVVFDNFLSLSDEELIAGVADHVPGFDGTAADGGTANDFIALALERVLADRGQPGRVRPMPRVDLARNLTHYAFVITDSGNDLRLCAIEIPGAEAVSERQLAALGSDFIGDTYSRSTLELFATGTLRRYYRQRGFWAAAFATPQGRLDGDCRGVTATITVTEGPPYRWAGSRWTGVTALPRPALDDALGMNDGRIADVVKIDDGLQRVTEIYRKAGFALEEHTIEPELEPDTQQATFVIAVTEGPQFRMGTFRVEGLPDRNIADLVGRWKMKPGDVFDVSYLRTFLAEQRSRIQLQDGPFMTPDVRLDAASGLADVTLHPINQPPR